MTNKIIINGRAGSGKDAMADYLVKKYGFTKIAFADSIYEIANKYFNMEAKNRGLLQQIGEKFRDIEPLIWVNIVINKAKQIDKVVISDCRRENEYIKTVIENNFLPIRINTDLDNRIKRIELRDGFYPNTSLFENESEVGADKCTFLEIDNNKGFNHLYEQIDWIMQQGWDDYILNIQKDIFFKQYA